MAKVKYVEEEISVYNFPGNVDEFIDYLNKKVAEQPVPRNQVRVEICAKEVYGDCSSYISLNYTRPMTASELDQERIRSERIEAAQRRQFEELSKKFGKTA